MMMEDLGQLIESVEKAYESGDEERVFELSADVMSVYLEALSDILFEGKKVEWLNDLVNAIDEGDNGRMLEVLEQEDDNDERFLGSHVAALFAGFRQRDNMMTLAQVTGIKALLDNM